MARAAGAVASGAPPDSKASRREPAAMLRDGAGMSEQREGWCRTGNDGGSIATEWGGVILGPSELSYLWSPFTQR